MTREQTNVAVELRDVSITWTSGGVPLLRDVCLQIQQGESLVLVGPSGQGKSTILKIVAGLIEPTEGQVLYYGKERRDMGPKERETFLLNMGMLFQRNALFDFLTVGDNIAFPLRERTHRSEEDIANVVENGLAEVGIAHARDLFPDEISGGMQKRLGIARALALQPKFLLYDDPTAGLDPITSRKITGLIRDLQKAHEATLIVVTNDMNRAYEMGDRLALVAKGKVLVTGTPTETQKHPDPKVQQFIRGQTEGPLTEHL